MRVILSVEYTENLPQCTHCDGATPTCQNVCITGWSVALNTLLQSTKLATNTRHDGLLTIPRILGIVAVGRLEFALLICTIKLLLRIDDHLGVVSTFSDLPCLCGRGVDTLTAWFIYQHVHSLSAGKV
jgi:hypothetical protein